MATKSVQFTEFSLWRKAVIEAGGEVIPLKSTAKSTHYEARNDKEEVIGTYAFSEGNLSVEAPAVGPKVPKPKVVKPKVATANESSMTTDDHLKKSFQPKAAQYAEDDENEDEEDNSENESNWEDEDWDEDSEEEDDDDFEDEEEDDEDFDGDQDESAEQQAQDPFPEHVEPEAMPNSPGLSIDESTLTDADHEQGNVALESFMKQSDPEFASDKDKWGQAKEYAMNPSNPFNKRWSVAAAAYNKLQGQPEAVKPGPDASDDVQYGEDGFVHFHIPREHADKINTFLKTQPAATRTTLKTEGETSGTGFFHLPKTAAPAFHAAAQKSGLISGTHYKFSHASNSQFGENDTQQFVEGVFSNPPHRKSLFHKLLAKYGGRVFGKNKKGWRGRGQYITQFSLPDHLKDQFHAAARAAGFKLGDHYEVRNDESLSHQHSESNTVPAEKSNNNTLQFNEEKAVHHLLGLGFVEDKPINTGSLNTRMFTHKDLGLFRLSNDHGYWDHYKGGVKMSSGGYGVGDGPHTYLEKLSKSQHAEGEEDETNEIANSDQAPVIDALPPLPMPALINPDMPAAAVDPLKMQAVLAGLARKNVVLPSTFTFQDPAAMDIILAALNSGLKAEDEAEAEFAAQANPESPPPTEVPMAYSEKQLNAQYNEALPEFPEDVQFAEKKPADDDHAYQIEIMHPTTIDGYHRSLKPDSYSRLGKVDQSIANLSRHAEAIHINLLRKMKKGIYDAEKAKKLFSYYTKGIADHLSTHHDLPKASPATRALAAHNLEEDFREKAKAGEYDHLLEKPKSSQHSEDDGGGVQSWSKGKLYPYTIMTIENEKGERHNQAMHPNGWKGSLHPWQGEGKSHKTAEQDVIDEINKHRSSQHSELPPEIRERIERLEAQNIQFQEEKKTIVNKAAREGALMAINNAGLPPALRNRLAAHYTTVQFNEGAEEPSFTAADVANLVSECLPPQLKIQFDEAVESEAPKASKPMGKDPQGNPLFNSATTEQFFEHSELPAGHVTGDKAEEIVKSGPLRTFGFTGSSPTISQLVAAENQRVPNNVMRK